MSVMWSVSLRGESAATLVRHVAVASVVLHFLHNHWFYRPVSKVTLWENLKIISKHSFWEEDKLPHLIIFLLCSQALLG